jgi:tripartite-type tricarboxylate transporter receptor subunit TctC
MKLRRHILARRLILGLLAMLCSNLGVFPPLALGASEDPAKALSGKTIRIIVGYSAGGGFDTLTRIVGRHLSKHLPGKPNITVSNMTGAGGAVALNYVYSRGTPDGLTWVASDGALVLSKILGLPGPDFDVEKFPWLGVGQTDHQACMVMTRTGITTAEQFLRSPTAVRLASTVPGDSPHIRPVIAAEALGANFKIIQGYPGTADMRLAMQSGDADAACWGWESMKVTAADMLERKEAIPILQIGLERHPDLPSVPNVLDFPMSNEAKTMLRLVAAPGAIAKLFALSPGTPEPMVNLLRKGFADTLKDRELLADAQKSKMRISYVSADEVTKIIKEMNSTSPELKQKVAKAARPAN